MTAPGIGSVTGVRSGQRFGSVRRDLGRRHGVGDLFHRRFHDLAGNAAVEASKPHDQAKRMQEIDDASTYAWFPEDGTNFVQGDARRSRNGAEDTPRSARRYRAAIEQK
jgi:hypothetical protein